MDKLTRIVTGQKFTVVRSQAEVARMVAVRAARLDRLYEADAPAIIIDKEIELVQDALLNLLDMRSGK